MAAAQAAKLDDGRAVTPELFRALFANEMAELGARLGPAYEDGRFAEASGCSARCRWPPNSRNS